MKNSFLALALEEAGLSNTLLGITQYGSTLGVALAQVVLNKVDKSVKPSDKAE